MIELRSLGEIQIKNYTKKTYPRRMKKVEIKINQMIK